jgi:pyruvate dehydrogenase E2 component (dihydrolipoamide acetyltransferase)
VAKETVKVPDIGGAENVDVIEVCVKPGDTVAAEDSLIVLESDKASMEIPAPKGGKVVSLSIKEGDTVSEGDAILELETEEAGDAGGGESAAEAPAEAPKASTAEAGSEKPASGGKNPVAVPDIGGAEGVDVIEISVAVGDWINEGDSLIVLESDKASMEIPSPASGEVLSITVKEGDKVSEGDEILILSGGEASPAEAEKAAEAPVSPAPAKQAAGGGKQEVKVPDIGGAEGVDIIEVSVAEGDEINEGDSIIVLESDKASMEIPSPASGKVVSLAVKEGDKVSQGDLILTLETAAAEAPAESAPEPPKSEPAPAPAAPAPQQQAASRPQRSSEKLAEDVSSAGSEVYAGPAVRKLARQLGVQLNDVKASGPRGRITKDDIRDYVKSVMQSRPAAGGATAGAGIPPIPDIDFAQFGEIEMVKMSKIKKVTAANMTRAWLNVPHVTQFDDADITEMEEFRKSMKAEAEKSGVKLTPLPFLLKACAAALKAEPTFNVALHNDGEHIVQKKYVHIGVAVDTPNGLTVPVIRDVDKKGLFQLAEEALALAKKARDGKLMPNDMKGACFTISSLGAIGGTGFTPMVNAPEVGILGVSRASIQPVWNGKEFAPRQMLPLALSYDHRAVNGADAGRFMTYLVSVLSDVRRLLV